MREALRSRSIVVCCVAILASFRVLLGEYRREPAKPVENAYVTRPITSPVGTSRQR